MKDYIILFLVFVLFFVSINTEVAGVLPPTFGYVFVGVVLLAGWLAYQRHESKYVKNMFLVSLTVQLVFFLALPYWILKTSMGLNITWPYFPEVLWATGVLVLWYYMISFVFLPIVVYLYGRRAWCSFICGTGVLAETLGDKYRVNGSKGIGIHPVFTGLKWLIIAGSLAFTALMITGDPQNALMNTIFLVVFILLLRTALMMAGNIVLMPRLGTRIWCKYFCPQGLLISLIYRVGRFALLKDNSLCTSCGTCNKHCHMSIDITGGPAVNRTGDCVGCGVCVEVCPAQALSMTNDPTVIREKSEKVGLPG